jgi:phage shock protein C
MSETDSPRPEGSRLLPPPPTPPGAAASPPKRLYRDPNSWLGGVASGLAAYFDIDPVVVRLLWIVALLTGVGFPAYLVCWVVIPKAKAWPPAGYAERVPSDSRAATLSSGLVIVALAALIGKGVNGMGDLLLPAALIGFGVYLLNQRSLVDRHSRIAGSGAVDHSGPVAEHSRAGRAAGVAHEDFVASAETEGDGQASPIGRSGLVTPTVLSLLAIGAGVCWALHAAGLVQLSIAGVAAGGLLIVGMGLLASLWLGRAPGLVLAGVGLAGVLLVASVVEPWFANPRWFQAQTWQPFVHNHLPASAGERNLQPRTLSELQPMYELGMGDLTLDLTQLDFSGEQRDVQVKLGLGELNVIVPSGTSVEAHGQVGLGEGTVLDHHEEGVSVRVDSSDPGQEQGSLRIDFSVGMGEGTVRRAQ